MLFLLIFVTLGNLLAVFRRVNMLAVQCSKQLHETLACATWVCERERERERHTVRERERERKTHSARERERETA